MQHKIKFTLLLLFLTTLYSFGQQQQANQRMLVGEWSRTETPYQLKITEALDNGKLEVSYFDPKSITIGKAHWIKNEAILSVYVELMDENNPGYYYKLNYKVERDILVGNYYQPDGELVQTVEFVRTKQ
ncbi:hypothetical protein [Flavobacterium limnophilum]|uniref:hypothetical protein n=1 Tax=Flavobacterium limnophilum TaxID=3003262 RepID=UPI0022AC81C9|nr:hypothetical protein [Flavobacterium limnophilum]